jgi:hypothetical protein
MQKPHSNQHVPEFASAQYIAFRQKKVAIAVRCHNVLHREVIGY